MKREPKPGESKLVHHTVETNHTAKFALDFHNYIIEAVQTAKFMLDTGERIGGFSLKPLPDGFAVWYLSPHPAIADVELTQNKVTVTGDTILLKTSVHSQQWIGTTLEERRLQGILAEAADLEQCAAIAIALKTGILIRVNEDILQELDKSTHN